MAYAWAAACPALSLHEVIERNWVYHITSPVQPVFFHCPAGSGGDKEHLQVEKVTTISLRLPYHNVCLCYI